LTGFGGIFRLELFLKQSSEARPPEVSGRRTDDDNQSLSLVSPEEVTAVERLGHLDNVKERACVRFPGRFLRCKNWLAAVGWANVARHSLAKTGACSI
jgi:hypothetical protein